MFLVSSCSRLCAIYRSQVLSRKWGCSRRRADRRCSDDVIVTNNFIAYWWACLRVIINAGHKLHCQFLDESVPRHLPRQLPELPITNFTDPLQWCHDERDSVSNHQPPNCLLNRLFRRRSKNISKLRVTGLCAGNSPMTGEFPAQMANKAERASVRWRHYDRG